ncbi:MAG: hypothetical protein SF052_21665 [Bacteroidia bacterium]|nr:hypothetical protein [Bacteroidia bacterium]
MIRPYLILLIFLQITTTVFAQQILLDKPVRAGELTVFPTISNPNEYYYLADKVQVAKHANGAPQFSFIKYVRNTDAVGGGTSTITESDNGGGIVHAVVQLSVSPEQLADAQRALRRINGAGKIVGPVVYKSGTLALISSVASPQGGMSKQVIGLGSAPILDGQKAAISIQLTKEGSDILWATFQTPTPDMSVSFEMEVEGYLSPKRVIIEADFERIYKNQTFEAAAVTPVLAAEIQMAFDELHDQGAIKVTQIGEDEGLNKLMETAYNKLTTLMFEKIGGTGVPELNQLVPGGQRSMLDRATDMLNTARREARDENRQLRLEARQTAEREARTRSEVTARRTEHLRETGHTPEPIPADQRRGSREERDGVTPENRPVEQVPMPSLAIAVSYRMKSIKQTGSYKIDLNKYTSDTRTMRFDENLGSVKSCKECFLRVNLDDPLYKQRDIYARLDGLNAQDFGTYINFVTVLIMKKHQDGSQTVKEIQIDKSKFNTTGNDFVVNYGWKGDDDRNAWLNYQYKAKWSFFGGYEVETDWQNESFGSISLVPPLVKKPIYIEADPEYMTDQKVRSVELKLYYKLGTKEETRTLNLQMAKNELSRTVELILPKGKDDYEFQTTWFVRGKPQPVSSARIPSTYGMVYLDQLP